MHILSQFYHLSKINYSHLSKIIYSHRFKSLITQLTELIIIFIHRSKTAKSIISGKSHKIK